MASVTAPQLTSLRSGARWALWFIGGCTVAALAMFIVGTLVQSFVAGEHGQFHALFASVFLVPALVLAVRQPRGGPASTPVVIGLGIAAITQLVEGIGGFGYGPGNADRVNALAEVHDLGVAIAPIGLVSAAIGMALGVAQLVRPRFGLLPGIVLSALVLGGLGVLIAKMIGL